MVSVRYRQNQSRERQARRRTSQPPGTTRQSAVVYLFAIFRCECRTLSRSVWIDYSSRHHGLVGSDRTCFKTGNSLRTVLNQPSVHPSDLLYWLYLSLTARVWTFCFPFSPLHGPSLLPRSFPLFLSYENNIDSMSMDYGGPKHMPHAVLAAAIPVLIYSFICLSFGILLVTVLHRTRDGFNCESIFTPLYELYMY